jgi:ribonucleoside-diphosphate reductase alpha subunit
MSSPSQSSFMNSTQEMNVTKRDGNQEIVSFDKILKRIKTVGLEAGININYTSLVIKVIDQLYDCIPSTKIDELLGEQCVAMSSIHPDYNVLASRVAVSNHHKNTLNSFSTVMKSLYHFVNKRGEHAPLISKELYDLVVENARVYDDLCVYERDFLIDYFGFKTLEKSYLMRINKVVVERPQHMWLRTSIGIHGADLEAVKETYNYMSLKHFTHATPTLYNAGTPRPQLSSCYLLSMEDDSIDGIFNTLKECAQISKWAGGIGLHIHNVRATGTHIHGTNGTSNGIVPMLRVFNNTAKYVDQGGGKRNGSFAIYLEPWHSDVEMFLQMRKNHGDEELKARDLFYALWIPDLFMERVKTDGSWMLVCPHECPGLADVWGEAFVELYTKYEKEGRGRKTMKARDLWFQILDSVMETGTPYLLYKDACNAKSNQQNVGTIKSSNLCTEIVEYSSPEESAVCNLASLALPAFVGCNITGTYYDFDKLHKVAKVVTRNLNRIIDINYYPTDKTKLSNMRHRPIGIGVQGLADVFMIMGMAFGSDKSKKLNRDIFETIYHAAVEASCDLADRDGAYSTFEGSPASEGRLQFDLWGVDPGSERYDWAALKERVKRGGMRNSLLLAPMPTASTSQILGYNECIEPITSNLYSRSTSAGSFVVANKYMMRDLIRLGVWNEDLKNNIIANNGSIQHLEMIPVEIKELYKTVWEIPTKTIIQMAADRGVFICQSQSLNIWVENPDYKKLTNIHFYSHSLGLKTACYYLRRKAAAKVQQFTIEPENTTKSGGDALEYTDDEPCEMCSA